MKRSRFSELQIAYILRQAEEGTSVEEVCRKAGISEATYYNWRKKYGGLSDQIGVARDLLAHSDLRIMQRRSAGQATERPHR